MKKLLIALVVVGVLMAGVNVMAQCNAAHKALQKAKKSCGTIAKQADSKTETAKIEYCSKSGKYYNVCPKTGKKSEVDAATLKKIKEGKLPVTCPKTGKTYKLCPKTGKKVEAGKSKLSTL